MASCTPSAPPSYLTVHQEESTRCDKGDVVGRVVFVLSPAADVTPRGFQAKGGALQRGQHRHHQGGVGGFWVVLLHLIHPALGRETKKCTRRRVMNTSVVRNKPLVRGLTHNRHTILRNDLLVFVEFGRVERTAGGKSMSVCQRHSLGDRSP